MKTHLTVVPTTDAEIPRIDTRSDLPMMERVRPCWMAPFFAVAFVAAVFMVTGCAGDLDNIDAFLDSGIGGGSDAGTLDGGGQADSGPAPDMGVDPCPQYVDIHAELVVPQCASSFCHDSDRPSVGLDLLSDGFAARLVDVASTSDTCAGEVFIDSNDPSQSLLLEIVTPNPPCSQTMPFGAALGLSPEDTACFEVWILDQLGRST